MMVRASTTDRITDPSPAPLTFRFRNLGPVKTADLELGDLTIIAGRNNTGKTYVAYTLYGFLKMWERWPESRRLLLGEERSEEFPDLRSVAERLVRDGSAGFPLSREAIARQQAAVLQRLSNEFSEQAMPDVFSIPDEFEDASIEIISGGNGSVPARLANELTGLSIEYDGSTITWTVHADRSKIAISRLRYVAYLYVEFLLTGMLPDPFILSAERFGISLFYRELDFTKNQLVDLLQKMADDKNRERAAPFLIIDRATSRYAMPIKDNIDYTRSIPERRRDKGELHEHKLYDYVKDMMDGYYGTSGDEIRFISKSRGRGRSFNIPLHAASSSARGLSDFYFYLRHVVRQNHLLIVDEPESHLDTMNQIRLARLLARFVNAGVKVLITTHSDYLIKEFNNLVMLSQTFEDKEKLVSEFKYHPHDLLRPESISAYVAENNGLTKCAVDRFGIDMPVFDKTIDEINTVANALSSRLTDEA